MQSKPGLGRGLGALLSSTPTEGDTLVQVRVDQVEANPYQPRKAFDSNALEVVGLDPIVWTHSAGRRETPGTRISTHRRRAALASRSPGGTPDSRDSSRGH